VPDSQASVLFRTTQRTSLLVEENNSRLKAVEDCTLFYEKHIY
jgi:hypothetical protein